MSTQAAAEALSQLAYTNSLDEQFESPYAKECTKEQELMVEAQKDKVKSLPGPFGKVLGGVANAALQIEVCIVCPCCKPLPTTSLFFEQS